MSANEEYHVKTCRGGMVDSARGSPSRATDSGGAIDVEIRVVHRYTAMNERLVASGLGRLRVRPLHLLLLAMP